MCCICTTGAGSCRTPKSAQNVGKPQGNPIDVNISVLFSSHTYDFIVDNSEFKLLETNDYTSTYGRFATYLVYPNTDPDKAPKTAPQIHMPIFIDVASEEYGVAAGVCSCERMLGFLSRAVSAIKDYLYQKHLEGKHGTVHFYLGAYDPLEALMFSLADLLGKPNTRKEYKDFVAIVNRQCWFAVLSGWMKKLHWTPKVEAACVYLGKDDIVEQESQVSKNRKRIKKINKILDEMHSEQYFYRGGTFTTSHEKIDEWKKKYRTVKPFKIGGNRITKKYEGYTILRSKKYVDSGHWYIPNPWYWDYRIGNVPEIDGTPSYKEYNKEKDKWVDAPPRSDETEFIASPFEGLLYSYEQLALYMNEMEAADPAPKMWGIKNPPRPIGKTPKQQMDEYIAELEREKAEWERNTYNPEKAAYTDALKQIDERENESTDSYKIWKRKKDEDEAISNEWDANKDKIEFHGQIVSRAELVARDKKLENIKKQKQAAIDKAYDQKFWTTVLEFVVVFQMLLAIASFGVGSIGVGVALAAVDAGIEIFKANIEVKYFDKNWTDGEMWSHWVSIALDGVTMILSAPRIFCAKPPKMNIPKAPKVAKETPPAIVKPNNAPNKFTAQSYITTPTYNLKASPKPKLEPVPVPEYKPMTAAKYTHQGKESTVVGVSHTKVEAANLGKKADKANAKNGANTMEVNWENETGGQYMYVATKNKNGKISVEHMSAKDFKQRTGIDPSELDKTTKAKKAHQTAINRNKEIEAQNAASNAAPQSDILTQLNENSVSTAERSGNSTLAELTTEPPARPKVEVTKTEKAAATKERSSLLQRAHEYGSMVMDNLKKDKSDFVTGAFVKKMEGVTDRATFVWTIYGIGSNAEGLMGHSIGWSIVNVSETHSLNNFYQSDYYDSIENLERKELPEQNVIAYLPK